MKCVPQLARSRSISLCDDLKIDPMIRVSILAGSLPIKQCVLADARDAGCAAIIDIMLSMSETLVPSGIDPSVFNLSKCPSR